MLNIDDLFNSSLSDLKEEDELCITKAVNVPNRCFKMITERSYWTTKELNNLSVEYINRIIEDLNNSEEKTKLDIKHLKQLLPYCRDDNELYQKILKEIKGIKNELFTRIPTYRA